MIGRGNNKYKRFNLGIYAMEYIIMHNSMCEMKSLYLLIFVISIHNLPILLLLKISI